MKTCRSSQTSASAIAARLLERVAIARRRDVPARASVREGRRRRAVAEELEDAPDADIVVVSAARARHRFDVIGGRDIERRARHVAIPVLGIHRGDRLDLDGALHIALLHWTREGGIAAAERVHALFDTKLGPPSLSLVRVGSPRRRDADDERLTADVPQATRPPASRDGHQASGPVVNALDEASLALRERGIDATPALVLDGRAEAGRARICAFDADVVALAGDAPRRAWPRRGEIGRISPRLSRPVLVL